MTQTQLAWLFELLWLVFAALATVLVLVPVYGVIQNDYLIINAAFVFLTVTFFRLFLYVKRVPYLSRIWMRAILIGILGILFFQFMAIIQDFFYNMDNATMSRFLTLEKALQHSDAIISSYLYFKKEFILFATACQIMIVLLVLRTVVSMWQYGPKVSMNR